MKDIFRLTFTSDQKRKAKASAWEIIRPGIKKRSVYVYGGEFSEKRFFCQDCETVSDLIDFVVNDFIWREGMGKKIDPTSNFEWQGKPETINQNKAEGIICIHCFEKRLGRKLCLDDLVPDIGINEKFFFGAKMPKCKPTKVRWT